MPPSRPVSYTHLDVYKIQVQQRLEEDGIKLSQEAIRRYYHSQILPARLARENKTAEELNKISVEGVDEATMRAIRSAALDLAASPSCDPKALNILAVSYTHLGLPTPRPPLTRRWRSCSTTVSYTHLDVYKRQARSRAAERMARMVASSTPSTDILLSSSAVLFCRARRAGRIWEW